MVETGSSAVFSGRIRGNPLVFPACPCPDASKRRSKHVQIAGRTLRCAVSANQKAAGDANGRDVVIDDHGRFPFRLTNCQDIDYTAFGAG
jgi:hypothetical protein